MTEPGDARHPENPEMPDTPRSFAISGELDLQRSDRLEPQLLAHANRSGYDEIIIDCAGLTFVDSSGLGMLVDVRNQTGKQLVLKNVTPACRQVFELTGLDRVFAFA